jgi:hypothetical protein
MEKSDEWWSSKWLPVVSGQWPVANSQLMQWLTFSVKCQVVIRSLTTESVDHWTLTHIKDHAQLTMTKCWPFDHLTQYWLWPLVILFTIFTIADHWWLQSDYLTIDTERWPLTDHTYHSSIHFDIWLYDNWLYTVTTDYIHLASWPLTIVHFNHHLFLDC